MNVDIFKICLKDIKKIKEKEVIQVGPFDYKVYIGDGTGKASKELLKEVEDEMAKYIPAGRVINYYSFNELKK